MTSLKKELQDSGIGSSGGSNKKVAACSSKTNNNNKGVEVVSIPSDDWFTQMYGPMGENSEDKILSAKRGEGTKRKKILKNTKIKAKKRKRISSTTTNSTSSDLIEIDVSDGEDLNQVFPPLLSPQTSKNKEENKVEKTEKNEIKIEKNLVKNDKNKGQASFSDDDLDFVVLFESITEKNLKKENAQDNDDSDDSFIFSKNTLKRPPKIIKNAQDQVRNDIEENFGITLYPNKVLFEKISNYMNKYKNEFDNFNRNIWTHFTENLQNDHTYTWKMRVKCMLEDIVKQIFPSESISLVAVGSTVNGCGAFNSDMDLCLCMPCRMDGYETQRNYAINRLKKVMRKLMTQRTLIHDILFVPAKVPILKIKFKHPYQKLEVDMNINNVPGIYNSYLIHYYSRIDDRFPALCLIVKHWAKKKGILDACSGYFNSYSLILMVLHFLQCGINIPILPNLQHLFPDYFHFFRALDEMQLFVDLPKPLPEIPKNTLSIGELLIAFFNYYNNFNFDEYAISVYRGCIYPRSELARNTRRFKIFIEEPFDFKNTARCVTSEDNFLTILDTFREAVEICCSLPPNLKRLIAS
uniref:Uncharacterized protein n=1 Tax=Meloidogyne enterolobii TaxID=390850 RepID=A0A6V7XWZ9_MELEN|nr:unnamed protein product [Meloidogyne enterolobii]